MNTQPPPTLTGLGLQRLTHIRQALLLEFDTWCTADVYYHTKHQATLTITPINQEGRPRDLYTVIHCHINIESLNSWIGSIEDVYEWFCELLGESLYEVWLDRREPKRLNPKIGVVIIRW